MTRMRRKDPRRSRAYQFFARRVREEERYICAKCGGSGYEVDHIKPLHDGGELMDRDNVQVLCSGCHISKTELERPGRIPGRREWKERLYDGL